MRLFLHFIDFVTKEHNTPSRIIEIVCFLFLISFLNVYVHGSNCAAHSSKGCEYCILQSSWWSNCRWCELDEKCHAKGSVSTFNQCNINQVIKTVADCPIPETIGEYNPQHAYDLLRFSTIPYTDDQNGAIKCLNSHQMNDFEIVEWIGRHCEDIPLITYKECLAVVMVSKTRKSIILAYRGTTSSVQFLEQLVAGLFKDKVPANIGSGEAQSYFKQAHDKLYDCVKESMQNLISNYPNYDISITGHSLGGALASIASARLSYDGLIRKDKIALYTFGMPRVGNRQYALEHNRLLNNSWRVIHLSDPVPHFPTSTLLANSPLHHRTEVYYPSSRMLKTDTNYIVCPGSDNSNCGSKFISTDIDDHLEYFDIRVGTYCESVVGRKRRSIKSAMWNLFNNNTCSRIKNPTFAYNNSPGNTVVETGYVKTTMLLFLLQCCLFS